MSTNLVVNGTSYAYPATGDQNWGSAASAWATAVTGGMLQKSGGSFTLTADANFGTNFGLLSKYFTSSASSPSASGVVRLANADGINWRNAANSADLSLTVNASNVLQFAGSNLILAGFGSIVNADVNASAAIAYSKLALTGSILNADLSGSIAASKLIGTDIATVGTIISGTWGATTIAVAHGGTGVTSVTTSPAASSFAGWDAHNNLSANNHIEGYRTTATAAGTTALLVGDAFQQIFTGSTTQTVTMPVTSTLVLGQQFQIANLSTGAVTVQSSGANTIQAMATNTTLLLTCISITGAGTSSWTWSYQAVQNSLSGGGTVASVTFTGDGTILSSTPSSAVTTTGTVTASLISQVKNTVLAGPSSGSNANPTFRALVSADLSPGYIVPTIQKFTSTGSQTGWLFTVTGWTGTIVAGDTYTNNGHTYTAQAVTQTNGSSGQTLFMSGTGATSGGTLTKATSASGPATITFSATLATATYTSPANVLYIRLRALGGGGGGSGSGTTGAGNGVSGTSTFFGANAVIATGGIGGLYESTSGIGGTCTLGTAIGLALAGGYGGNYQVNGPSASVNFLLGGMGGGTFLFPPNQAGGPSAAGSSAPVANSGVGGQGGATSGTGSNNSGVGGGGGGGCDAILTTGFSGGIPYAIGAGGANGSAGTSGFIGGSGAAGLLEVTEFYQ